MQQEHHGLLTPEEAKQRSRSWVEDYAVQALKARPAKEQLETLRSLAENGADPGTSMFALIPPEQRERLQREADRDAMIAAARGAVEKADKWKRDIAESAGDLGKISRKAIEDDPDLDVVHRSQVLGTYDSAMAAAQSFDEALRRFRAGEAFSPE
jgi:hypothetical protein